MYTLRKCRKNASRFTESIVVDRQSRYLDRGATANLSRQLFKYKRRLIYTNKEFPQCEGTRVADAFPDASGKLFVITIGKLRFPIDKCTRETTLLPNANI